MPNSSEYMADYRARNPNYVKRQKKLKSAREKAMRHLATIYAKDFQALLRMYKRELGVD